MSVFVKGMEMPYGYANCQFCGLPIYDSHGFATYVCNVSVEGICGKSVTNEVINMYDGGGAECFPNWCPLNEVPESHGDLIDRDELLKDFDGSWSDEEWWFSSKVEDAVAIIPSEMRSSK